MNFRVLLFLGLSLFSFSMLFSENPSSLTIDMQYRPRAEYRNGWKVPMKNGDEIANNVEHRARFGVKYDRDYLSMKFSVQNVGVWGASGLFSKNSLALNEAWFQLKNSRGLFAKLGRQTLLYDDGRLFTTGDWVMAAKFHDVAKLGYEDKKNLLHLVVGYSQNNAAFSGNYYQNSSGVPYKSLEILYYKYSGLKNFTPSIIFVNMGYESGIPTKSSQSYMQTAGTNLKFNPIKNLSMLAFGYYQFGNVVKSKKTSAFLAGTKINYGITSRWGLNLGTEFISGESNVINDDTYSAFNLLTGGIHGKYGAMDYFFNGKYYNGLNPGLWSKCVGLEFKTTKKSKLSANYFLFSTATTNKINNKEERFSSLGSELDFRFDCKVMSDVSLSLGYSAYFANQNFEQLKGGSSDKLQDWGWIMIKIDPEFLLKSWK